MKLVALAIFPLLGQYLKEHEKHTVKFSQCPFLIFSYWKIAKSLMEEFFQGWDLAEPTVTTIGTNEKTTVKTYHDIMYMRVIYAFLIYLVLLFCYSKQWDMALSSRRVRVMFVVQRSGLWSIRNLATQKPLAVLGTQQFLLAIALMTSIERKTTSLRDGVRRRPRNGGPLGSNSWDVSFREKETVICNYIFDYR